MRIYFKLFLLAVTIVSITAFVPKKQTAKYGALAVDRNNGFYYGWAYDYDTRAEAEQRALEECRKRGGSGTVVLVWQGKGCGAYRTINGNVGTAYGWGVAETQSAADAIATQECLKRSNGNPASNHVWACNSSGAFKELYNATRNDNSNTTEPAKTSAKEYLTFNGSSYEASGDCPGSGTASLTSDDESFIVIINNLPSGSSSVNANYYTEACTSCLAIQVQDLKNEKTYIATSGNLTRKGNNISINISVKDMEAVISGGGSAIRVTGSWNCEE
jgi:hypothetical protein